MTIVHSEIAEHIDQLVANPAVVALYRQWLEAAPPGDLPAFEPFDPRVRPADGGHMMVLEPGADSLRYTYYGRLVAQASGFDMTGRSTLDVGGELGRFAEEKYRFVLASGRPLYIVANAGRTSSVVSWERLILPLRRRDGVAVIVCYGMPLIYKAEILDGLMDASMDGIIVLQPVGSDDGAIDDFRYLMVNRRSGEILGRDPESLIGRAIGQVFPRAVDRIPIYREVMETGIPRQIEVEMEAAEGRRAFRLSAVRAGDKLVVTLTDVTTMRRLVDQLERRESDLQFTKDTLENEAANLVTLLETVEHARADARAAERFVVDLMEAVPIPLFHWNLDGTMNRANRHYAAVYGLTPETVVGKRADDLLPPLSARFLLEQNERLLRGAEPRQVYEGDVEVPGRGRRRFVVHRALMHDPSEQPVGIAGAMLDLTDEYQLRSELERLASTDAMTGLANRRIFMERLDSQLARFRRHQDPVSVAILDVDHFKSVNDTHGHDFGDLVLIGLARMLRAGLREGLDVAARLGGEEFAILLPDADGPSAVRAAERLRREFSQHVFDAGGTPHRFSASFGVAELCPGEDAPSLLKRADEALYRAKAAGRDRVVLAEPSPPTPRSRPATR